MKAAPFAYERPSDLNAAITLMAEARETARLIAGGQSLGPMLNLRLVQPDLIIDIAGLAELKQAERSGDELVIGGAESDEGVNADQTSRTYSNVRGLPSIPLVGAAIQVAIRPGSRTGCIRLPT